MKPPEQIASATLDLCYSLGHMFAKATHKESDKQTCSPAPLEKRQRDLVELLVFLKSAEQALPVDVVARYNGKGDSPPADLVSSAPTNNSRQISSQNATKSWQK